MGKDVIVACDFASAEATFAFLDKFTEEKPFVKIGMELYYAEGPSIVRELKKRGHKIFLDLKLHDIPNTVKKSMAVLSRLDVDMTNVHAAGTSLHFVKTGIVDISYGSFLARMFQLRQKADYNCAYEISENDILEIIGLSHDFIKTILNLVK